MFSPYQTMKIFTLSALPALLIFMGAPLGFGDGIPLGAHGVVSFASVDTGRNVLGNRDEFIAALSPLDRSARLKTEQAVSEKAFLDFVGRSVLAWNSDETNNISAMVQSVAKKLAPWKLRFPPTTLLIKTTGQEEFGFAYTRQNAIILPETMIPSAGTQLLLHELFHVLSRYNPDLRTNLYRLLGFNPINEVELPPDLRLRKGTDPDGVQNGWRITVSNQNHTLDAVPILVLSSASFDPNQAGKVDDCFRLLVVTNRSGRWVTGQFEGQPRLLKPAEADGFQEQIGRNTGYIIHPDEILADNFVLLINGATNLPTPRIIAEMKKVLAR